jgi:hypothetical protein
MPSVAWLLAAFAALSVALPSQGAAERIGELLDAYSRGDYTRAVREGASWRDLRDLRKIYPKAARVWIERVPADVPRRRLVAAGLVLEVVKERYERDWTTWHDARELVEWSCQELRRGPATSGEQAWHRASVALAGRTHDWRWLSGVNPPRDESLLARPGPTTNHLLHAWGRFPTDSFFWVAKAITLADQFNANSDVNYRADRVRSGTSDRGVVLSQLKVGLDSARRESRSAIREFDSVLAGAEWSARAKAHVANLYLMMHDNSSALSYARDAVKEARDRRSRYLGHFIAGMSLERLGRAQEARATYLDALDAFPGQVAAFRAAVIAGTDAGMSTSLQGALDDGLEDPYHLINYGMYVYWHDLIEAFHRELR